MKIIAVSYGLDIVDIYANRKDGRYDRYFVECNCKQHSVEGCANLWYAYKIMAEFTAEFLSPCHFVNGYYGINTTFADVIDEIPDRDGGMIFLGNQHDL